MSTGRYLWRELNAALGDGAAALLLLALYGLGFRYEFGPKGARIGVLYGRKWYDAPWG